ncbi:hypothetical protein RHSIM_Rhsim03G0043300 [Rhododendron simsii]|uniref:Uncharacterized protein n=1 Tax=Rhododendron simsii TaxID=118357 RepID=A0A834H620_RHOSS|nr:hypothetical protein RHSIM_Rhsim03G0043300 [Rhododendron simsii]
MPLLLPPCQPPCQIPTLPVLLRRYAEALRASSSWLATRAHGKPKIKPKCCHIISYTLNFDNWVGQNGHFDFSSRYAAIPVSTKSSMDLGRDALVFRGRKPEESPITTTPFITQPPHLLSIQRQAKRAACL